MIRRKKYFGGIPIENKLYEFHSNRKMISVPMHLFKAFLYEFSHKDFVRLLVEMSYEFHSNRKMINVVKAFSFVDDSRKNYVGLLPIDNKNRN